MSNYSELTLAGEYLRELRIARHHLLALAEAVPEASLGWKPVEDARTLSAVLVHIATGNILLLLTMGTQVHLAAELYGTSVAANEDGMLAVIRRNVELERTYTAKTAVAELLKQSFDEVEKSILSTDENRLETPLPAFRGHADGFFFADDTTVRRLYLRMLAHTHEHMGQAIAYVRMFGMKAPWPDPLAGVLR